MGRSLAIHEATVDVGDEAIADLTVIAKRGVIKLLDGATVVRQALYSEITEPKAERVFVVTVLDAPAWVIARTGGCQECGGGVDLARLGRYRG